MAKRRPTPGMCLGSLRALLVAAVPRRSRKARISSGAVLAEAYVPLRSVRAGCLTCRRRSPLFTYTYFCTTCVTAISTGNRAVSIIEEAAATSDTEAITETHWPMKMPLNS